MKLCFNCRKNPVIPFLHSFLFPEGLYCERCHAIALNNLRKNKYKFKDPTWFMKINDDEYEERKYTEDRINETRLQTWVRFNHYTKEEKI